MYVLEIGKTIIKNWRRLFFTSTFLLQSSYCIFAQQADSTFSTQNPKTKLPFFENAYHPNKKRIIGVTSVAAVSYVGSLVALDRQWYAAYPRSKFHFFDDSREWNQIDKCGHLFSAYSITMGGYNLMRWAGASNRDAALAAGATSFFVMSSIELLDGFSQKWGASWSDLGANFAGAAIATSQYLIWKEQRFSVKISFHLNPYPAGELRQRADELFGRGVFNLVLKDYNNLNFWLSANPYSFAKNSKFPKWLNFAVGYGAGNLYGGFENKWIDKAGIAHDRSDVTRYRKFFISIDYDLSRIKTRTKAGKIAASIFNIIKLPAPAIEFNTLGQVVFHPCFFLNFEMPIYLKK